MTGNYFCVCHKNRQKHNQHFKLLCFKRNSHFGKSSKISECRKLNLLHIDSICLVVSSLEMQRRLIQTKVFFLLFSLCLKRNDLQIFKNSSCKKILLPCARYRYNLLRWMFFIPFDNYKSLSFIKVCRYSEIFSAAVL